MLKLWLKIRCATVALCLMPALAAHGDDTPAPATSTNDTATQFVRVAEDEQGRPRALQLAVISYVPRHDPGRFSVDLVSAIHIGDSEYYQELNERFKDYDALLYEMVAPEGAEVPQGRSESGGFVASTQLAMTRALDLSYQLDEIDYAQANFIHADLSAKEFARSMADRGDFYVYFWRIVYATIEEYARDPLGLKDWQMLMSLMRPDQDDALKIALAYEMTEMDRVFGDDSDTAIIGARNERAVQVLRQQLAAGVRHIGIFYGAAHMPDLEERLLELGLVPRRTTWIDAWKLGISTNPAP